MFRTLLIANRGEIACRIIRTARRMGLRTIAVYSDADAHSLHVQSADEAHRIGPPAPRGSYLNIPAILAAAKAASADAIHPGYGFLSENADFAEACAQAGITFVGPPPAAIRAMGGKAEAKALMAQAGVPLVPGYHGEAQDEATLTAEAARIGYPVLIKASAGGGGKGMRVVETPEALQAALAAAKRESLSAFNDDRVLIERYLQRPRHIEIQVFADTHGNAVHLFERDCSIQRRHQKIIEEAPAPNMDPVMREAMGAAAVAAARAVNYVGAGTVEFIAEGTDFHFMEMNTRLQVEHPVTEAITGQDLVEWQLRVAAGQFLPLTQHQLAMTGHAIEVRLYAEDPTRNFLPSIGRLTHLNLSPTARIDTGVRAGDTISPDYDPMIAKLIVHAEDRETALARLRATLSASAVAGVQTNLPLLAAIANHPDFQSGPVDTGFIPRNPTLLTLPDTPAEAIAAAALAILTTPPEGDPNSPWSTNDSWRPNLEATRHLTLRQGPTTLQIEAAHFSPSRVSGRGLGGGSGHPQDVWRLAWNGESHTAALTPTHLTLDSTTHPLTVLHDHPHLTILLPPHTHTFSHADPLAPPRAAPPGADHVLAPIPGRIASVLCRPGDKVTRGQPLVILEAMKMEMTLTAAMDGTISTVRCAAGDMVPEGADLIAFDTQEGSA